MNVPITADDIVKALLDDRHKGFIDRIACQFLNRNGCINQLIDLTFHNDKQIGFRACWLLDTVMTSHLQAYVTYLPYFIDRFKDVANPSCQRHFARILNAYLNPKATIEIKHSLTEINFDEVVEKCFDWLISPGVKVAVKALAADILYRLTDRYDWIAAELENQIVFMMRDGTAAIQSRGKKIINNLHKKRKPEFL